MASKEEQPSRLRGILLRRTLRTFLVVGVGLLAALVFLMGGSAPAAANTPVSGVITVDTTWTAGMSPIWVEGDVLVTGGATLTIDPGVEVRFNGFYDLTVADGALVADGDAAGAGIIQFTSNFTFPFAGAWDGIYINGDLGNSVLDDIEIQWATTGLTFNGASVPVSNTQILDSLWYGVYVGSSSVLAYDLSFTGCTISNAGSYGMYFSSMFDTNLTLQVSGCTFSGYGSSGLAFGSLQWADFDITVADSSFNASNRAVTFDSTNWGDLDEGNALRFTFRDNWLNSSSDFAGVYMPWDMYDFDEVTLVFDGNTFIGGGGRGYGLYLDDYWGAPDSEQAFTLQVTNNVFQDLTSSGVQFDQIVDFRNTSLIFTDNTFENTIGTVMDYGVYTFWAPYYSLDTYDNWYTLTIERNTAIDLSTAAVYMVTGTADGFRNVDLSIDGNDFLNAQTFPTMDHGVYLPQFRYDDWSEPGTFTLSVDGNTAVDLDDYAVYFTSSISGFRTVDIGINGNTFQNNQTSLMDGGVFFSSSPSYTTSYPGSFTLVATGNGFQDISNYALYFVSISSFSDVAFYVANNDFSGSSYGFYLAGGVDYAETLAFAFSDNTASMLGNWALYASGFTGLSLTESTASFTVSGNTISDSPNGLYLGSVTDYSIPSPILIENNVMTDITGTAIELGWHDRTNSRVMVRSNTITGPTNTAILLNAFDDQTAVVDITLNTIQGAERGIQVTYPAYSSGDTTLNIVNNDVQDISEYGIYIYEVYRAAAFITISDNVVTAAQDSFFSAGLIYFDGGGNGWYRALADIDITSNVLDGGLHAVYFHGTSGLGATILFDISQLTVTESAFGVTLDFPVGHAADIMNVRIADSTFLNNHRGFLFMNQPGWGLLPVDIRNVQVTGFGTWGGYAFFMGANNGGIVEVNVHSSTFQAASGALGDVYAGTGPLTMNFWYIDSITSGVSNDPAQIIRTLWVVNVEVMIGKNLDTRAPSGIVVYATDQFGRQSFMSVTDSTGMVTGQLVSGNIIAYTGGTSYAGPAVNALIAEWGPFNATQAATFTSNATVQIFFTADNDGDGLHNAVDPDDDNDGIPDAVDQNPLAAGFLDYAAPPYSLHLWVLLGLIGAFVIALILRMWGGSPIQMRKKRPPKPPKEPVGMEEPLPPIELE
ncbi:MAG: right-handed parallel beta-helix repeat-containing protein [Thermoplasmata archaeon]